MEEKKIVTNLIEKLDDVEASICNEYGSFENLSEAAKKNDTLALNLIRVYLQLVTIQGEFIEMYKLLDNEKTCKNCYYSECKDNKCTYCHFEGQVYWEDTHTCDLWEKQDVTDRGVK